MIWGRVNDARILIFGWTISLKSRAWAPWLQTVSCHWTGSYEHVNSWTKHTTKVLFMDQSAFKHQIPKDVKNINSSDLTDIKIYIYNCKLSVSVLAYWKIACAVFNCTHDSRISASQSLPRDFLQKNSLLRKARVTWRVCACVCTSAGLCKMVIVCVCLHG